MNLLHFCTFFIVISSTIATKLNYPRVLLPIFDKFSVNFTLEVIDRGCYKWTSSRNDLIQITEYDDESRCSSRVVVSVLTKEKQRNTAIVLAENSVTGDVIRCDVILDVIYKLAVLTTTRELYLEEAPETFELIAQDSQGNHFTTLEGVEFNWKISTQNNYQNVENWTQVLRFLKFSESKYHEVPKTVEAIESLGMKGYMVLLEGIHSGSAKVTVRLPHQEYSHVPFIEVDIMILANIILDPAEAAILVGDSIDFRVLQLKQGKLEEISLDSQYFLEIESPEYAKIRGQTATGLKLGKTLLILRDRNIPDDKSTEKIKSLSPRATITVANAAKIGLSLLPYNNWVTVEDVRHEIAVDLYTRDDQKIILGPKYKVDSTFDKDLYFELSRTKNGSRISGETVKGGRSLVTGSFEKLHAENEMLIYPKLVLSPTRVILPFDPNFPIRHQIQFKASGGDGSYLWSSMNTQLISISQTGLAETKLDVLKKQQSNFDYTNDNMMKLSNIKVALAKNNFISQSAEILFLTPVQLSIVQYNFETPLGEYVKVHVALYAQHNDSLIPFTLCDNLIFDLDFSSKIFVEDPNKHDDDEMAENACRIYNFRSTNLGSTNLKISYKFQNKLLKDEINLNVFEKLSIFNPVENEIVLPIGSSRNIIYKHGPTKVYTIDSDLIKSLRYDKSIIDVNEFSYGPTAKDDKHVYTILCRKVGEVEFRFEIYNALNVKNYIPYVSAFKTSVHCVKPRFVNLYTTAQIKDGCPMEKRNSLMQIKKLENDVEIDIEILDESKRVLTNITSLLMDWKFFTGTDNLKHNALVYKRDVEEDVIEGVPIPKRTFLKTVLDDINQNFKIRAAVVEYDMSVLNWFGIKPEKPIFGIQKTPTTISTPVIENELNFYAVDNTLLPFDSISIFLSKKKTERVPIHQGSGFYEISVNENGIVTVEFDAATRQLVISPLKIGEVQVSVLDRCLMTEPAILFISVVSVERIEIEMADRVEKGKTIEAIVKLYDSNDRLLESLDSKNLDIYELSEEVVNSNLISIRLGGQSGLGVGEIRYIVTGVELGDSKVVVSSGRVNKISSQAAPVQVFSPLRLFPRNATIVIGSSIQIYSFGGPHPDVNIIYTVKHDDIARMDSSVAVGTKLGETIITGQSVGVNPGNGNRVIFSEDVVALRVIPLDKIKIRVPLVRLTSGATMPASIFGVPDISPIILGTLPSLKVQWSTNHPDVIEITSIFADAGIEYGEEDSISVRVKGLNPGKALLHATVSTSTGIKLKSSIEISVFKMLELESPKKISLDTIVIPPNSNIQLKANLDDTVYSIENEAQIIRVTRNGFVSSSEMIGRSLVIASSSDQTLAIPIEVKNIHYLMASLHSSNLKLNSVEPKIPLGFNLLLRITFHDNLGNEFSHNLDDVDLLRHQLSRKEEVDVTIGNNLTVNLNLLRETSNMIAVSLKESSGIKYHEDYLKLSVGSSQFVYPTRTSFSVGDIICFDSHVDSSSKWRSSDESILNINSETGVGQVLSSRQRQGDKVIVHQGSQATGTLKFDLEIRDADKIEFFKSFDLLNGELYDAHLIIKNHLQTDKISNLFGKNMSICSSKLDAVKMNFFTCKLLTRQSSNTIYLQHFQVVPTFDSSIGQYGCQVRLKTRLNDFNNLIKNNDVHLELEARLNNGATDVLTLKLVSGILVSPKFINVDQISSHGLTVIGLENALQKLSVTPSDPKALVISETRRHPDSTIYKFKLLKAITDEDHISIKIVSPITDQIIEIPVQSSERPNICSQRQFVGAPLDLLDYISKFGLIISTVIVAAVVFVIIMFYCMQKSQLADNQIFLSPSQSKNQNSSLNNSPKKYQEYPTMYRGPDLSSSSGLSPDSQVYGDTTFVSPERRLHRRFL